MSLILRPCEVRHYNDLMKLEGQAKDTDKAWILYNGINDIVIKNQTVGQEPTGEVHLTRRQFQAFVDWWQGEKP